MRKWRAVLILVAVLAAGAAAGAQTAAKGQGLARETQARGYWVDPATGLMWAAKDNGKDVSWNGAKKYCRKLKLAAYGDWRLPNLAELQGIYDKMANVPGLAGPRKAQDEFTWHVKGNLFLTGDEWSSDYRVDDRGHFSGYVWFYDFNEGRKNNDPTGWPYSFDGRRALCVRDTRN